MATCLSGVTDSGRGLYQKVSRDSGSNPGCVLFGNEDSGFGSWFSQRVWRFRYSSHVRNPRKVGVKIGVHKFLSSTRTRELTWKYSGLCAWNRTAGERRRKRAVNLASGLATYCTALQASLGWKANSIRNYCRDFKLQCNDCHSQAAQEELEKSMLENEEMINVLLFHRTVTSPTYS